MLRLEVFMEFWTSELTLEESENEDRRGDRQFDGRKMGYGNKIKVSNML